MKKVRLLTLTTVLPALQAQAIEVAPGDYEQYPVGATIGAVCWICRNNYAMDVCGR